MDDSISFRSGARCLSAMVSEKIKHKIIKYSSLGILVLQNVSFILLMAESMRKGRTKFIKASLFLFSNRGISVFYAEIIKFVASIILCCVFHRSLTKGLADIYTECVHNKREFAKMFIPAILYVILNILQYVALKNLSATIFTVTYQLKILTTALFTVTILKRSLGKQKWIALFFFTAGIAVVYYADFDMTNNGFALNRTELLFDIDTTSHTSALSTQQKVFGFIAVLAASILSGLAGIYFEKILKGSTVSLWVRNVQLAGPSIIFSLLLAFGEDYELIFKDGFSPASISSNMMQGFDGMVWTTVVINALGGLIVSVVIKFADNILKTLATSFSIVIICVAENIHLSTKPTIPFIVGACVAIASIFAYFIKLDQLIQFQGRKVVDMKEIRTDEGKEKPSEIKNIKYQMKRNHRIML